MGISGQRSLLRLRQQFGETGRMIQLRAQRQHVHEQPDHALSEFERRRNLQRAIEQLPDEQRTAVLLRLEHELSLEEIAEVTGAGRETVKSRLRYAMNRLREVLAE